MLLALAGVPAGTASAAPATPSAEAYRDALVRELNRVRARHGLSQVRIDRRLGSAAYAHSRDMVRNGYFAHGSWTTRVKASSSNARSIGEVLGWLAPDDPADEAVWLVRSWLRSPPHRAVLLGRGFGRVGIGRATGAGGRDEQTAVYTADFASLR